jgi:hypothetical protein
VQLLLSFLKCKTTGFNFPELRVAAKIFFYFCITSTKAIAISHIQGRGRLTDYFWVSKLATKRLTSQFGDIRANKTVWSLNPLAIPFYPRGYKGPLDIKFTVASLSASGPLCPSSSNKVEFGSLPEFHKENWVSPDQYNILKEGFDLNTIEYTGLPGQLIWRETRQKVAKHSRDCVTI